MKGSVIRVLLVSTLVMLLLATALALGVSADEGFYHTVRWGETLSGIAWRYGLTTQELADANGITNRHWIYAGQKLLIPGTPQSDSVEYKVKSGDTLSGIAAKYGVTTWEIAQRNGLWNPNLLFVGQKLAIPGGGEVVPETVAAPPVVEAPLIIESPTENASVTSPVTVTGFGRAFGNNLAVEILDQDGNRIAKAYATVEAELGQIGPFTAEVEFTPPAAAQPGRILVYSQHPRDGAMVDLASVEVTLQP
jgi:LysM repeat protein